MALIRSQNPDIIFFIEQWYPLYSLVKSELDPDYKFVLPNRFDPARLSRKGEYSSFAGMAAAVKLGIRVTAADGSDYVKKTGKWLSLEINGDKYLGVHYPQPQSENLPDKNFHKGVLNYAQEKKPIAIIGDFNTPKNIDRIAINGYKDLLPTKPTQAYGTKLDYIFLIETYNSAKAELISSAMSGDTLFSDHAATMVTL